MKACRNKITYLTFLLSLAIVLTHAVNLNVYTAVPPALKALELLVSNFRILALFAFFAISGFLFFQDLTPAGIKGKLLRRVRSLLIPYLLWNLIGYLYIVLLSILPGIGSHITGAVEPLSLESLIRNTLRSNYNVLWFLYNLMWYIAMTLLLYPLLKHKLPALLLLAGACFPALNNGFLWYWIPYLAGAVLGLHGRDLVTRRYSLPARVLAAAGILTYLLSRGQSMTSGRDQLFFLLLLTALLWIAGDFLAVDREPAWWMKLSFFTYCAHSLVLESVEKLLLLLIGDTPAGAVLDFLLAPMITMLVLIAAAFLLKKIKPLWSLLSGGRG